MGQGLPRRTPRWPSADTGLGWFFARIADSGCLFLVSKFIFILRRVRIAGKMFCMNSNHARRRCVIRRMTRIFLHFMRVIYRLWRVIWQMTRVNRQLWRVIRQMTRVNRQRRCECWQIAHRTPPPCLIFWQNLRRFCRSWPLECLTPPPVHPQTAMLRSLPLGHLLG